MKNIDLHNKFMKVVDLLVKKKLKTEPIQAVILGGSVARGEETKHSDIDINFYVKKADMSDNQRGFYKFKGKYIEEHYFPIENLKSDDLIPEQKIIYDKTGKIKQKVFDEKYAKKKFYLEIKKAEKYQKLAENYFKNEKYIEAFSHLYCFESPVFIIMHALPQRFNLPFPSFRLLGSINQIDKMYKTNLYKRIEGIYTFKNKNKREILICFNKSYRLMNKVKKEENPNLINLGFFDMIKVKYNVSGLKKTFEDYPFVYSYRFIIDCLTGWVSNMKIKSEYRDKLKKYLLNVLSVKVIDKDLVKDKLELSKELIKECKRIK
jgi:predicted nucleotidyltransferase